MAAQRALAAEPWGETGPLRVRMALHTGVGEVRDGAYVGAHLNRLARLLAAGHGEQILLSQATRDLVRDTLPDGVTLRDLGEHRLRDLQRPERVFQMLAPDLPADFPPLKSLEAFPNNLPIQLTSFIGREREMAEVARRFSGTRLLTLTGPGGTGKTRLALQVAAAALDTFPDGVRLVELAPIADPQLVLQAVAAVLGVREVVEQPLHATLCDALRPRHLLLVLDNCEHLVETCARLADTLLRTCPHLRILASSREALGIAGEVPFRVPSLALPDATEQRAEQVAQCEAARLFLERATTTLPSFALTGRNAPVVAQICRRLDGIPLALELAAARVRAMTVEQVAQRLDDRFRLLTGGSRTALPRQQTLRALIDWSYDQLSDGERALLRRLSVFAGGWTLDAAEAVCAGDGIDEHDVLDLLTRLVDKSLVLVEEVNSGAARYHLLETVRQYARAKLLEAGEAEAVRARHLDTYLRLAEKAASHGSGRPRRPRMQWEIRQLADYDNFRVALEWSRTDATGERELQLVGALLTEWPLEIAFSEGRRMLEEALARSDPSQRTVARARVLAALTQVAGMQTNLAQAGAWRDECIAILRELGEKRDLAMILMAPKSWRLSSEEAEMNAAVAEGMALLRETGVHWELALMLYLAGDAALDRGKYDEARAGYVESLTQFRELEDRQMMANPMISLAQIACVEGDFAAARALVTESLAIRREAGEEWVVAIALNSLGEVERCASAFEEARGIFAEGLALYRKLDDAPGIAWSLHDLGHVALHAGDYARATALFAESLAARVRHDYKIGIVICLAGVAAVAARTERVMDAARIFGAVEALLETMDAVLPPADHAVYDQHVANLRAHLDPTALATPWAEGRQMSLAEAIATAQTATEAIAVTPTATEAIAVTPTTTE